MVAVLARLFRQVQMFVYLPVHCVWDCAQILPRRYGGRAELVPVSLALRRLQSNSSLPPGPASRQAPNSLSQQAFPDSASKPSLPPGNASANGNVSADSNGSANSSALQHPSPSVAGNVIASNVGHVGPSHGRSVSGTSGGGAPAPSPSVGGTGDQGAGILGDGGAGTPSGSADRQGQDDADGLNLTIKRGPRFPPKVPSGPIFGTAAVVRFTLKTGASTARCCCCCLRPRTRT